MTQAQPTAPDNTFEQLQLADIHLPNTATDWPPAYGWWILLACGMGLLVILLRYQIKRRKRHSQQKKIQTQLSQLEQQLKQDQSVETLAKINTLLKRIALQCYPQKKVASLSGQQWLAFLDQSSQSKHFTQGHGLLLAVTPYQAKMPEQKNLKGLMTVVHHWVNTMIKIHPEALGK
ncbi:MAG: DUF4381 domain-containing protein [Thiotrichaceae bacterium]|nr:DUF4381 domain-containing protein [Thiotrichaceae bacterium]